MLRYSIDLRADVVTVAYQLLSGDGHQARHFTEEIFVLPHV